MSRKIRVSSPTALLFGVLFLIAALRPHGDATWMAFYGHILSVISGIAIGVYWMHKPSEEQVDS